MKGIVFEDKQKVALVDLPRPEPLHGTLVAKVEVAGICGSDLHTYFGHWGRPLFVQGHEVSAIVEEIGKGVRGFKIGDRICTECFSHCDNCEYCGEQQTNLCVNREYISGGALTGAFAEYIRVPATSALKMPASATSEQTVLVEPVAVALHAMTGAEAWRDSFTLVIGGGTIGLLTAAVAKYEFDHQTMIAVKYDHQAELARELDVDFVHKVTDGKTIDAVKEASSGEMADLVIDTVGSTAAIADAVDCARSGANVVLVALPSGRTMMPVNTIVSKELVLTGSSCYGYNWGLRDFEKASELVISPDFKAEKIITHRFPFTEAAAAFATAGDKASGSVKVLIDMV